MVTTATGIATSYIQFTRGSNATVTNNVGNIAWAGHNLLTNSESFDASAWIKAGSAVTANATVAPNGTTTADKLLELGGTSFHGLYQGGGALTSIPVTFSVFVKGDLGRDWVRISYDGGGSKTAWFNVTNGTIGTVNAGLTTLPPQLVGNGFYLIQISFTGAASGNVAIGPAISDGVDSYAGDASKGVTIWGASLYRSDLGGMVFNPAQPAGLGTYYPTTPLNSLGYTEDFSNAAWVRDGVQAFGSGSISNAAVSPNGLQNADLITENTAPSTYHFVYQILTFTNTNTFSVYAKPAIGSRFLYLRFFVAVNNWATAVFNIASGTVTQESNGSSWSGARNASITSAGNGWYRCSLTATGTTMVNVAIGLSDSGTRSLDAAGGEPRYTGDGTSGIYVWGAQLSNSASIDPYSPVYGAAVTSSAYYAPRLDYSPTTIQPLGMLVEEQRTNLITNSVSLSSLTTQGATLTLNAGTAPDGSSTAAQLAITSNTGNNLFFPHTSTIGQPQAASVWVKGTAGQQVYFSPNTNIAAGSALITFTGNWQRVTSSVTTGTGAGSYWALEIYNRSGGAGLPNVTFQVWGPQLEANASFPTSYIPTGASTVTRSADNVSLSPQAFPYSGTEGTIVANFTPVYTSGPLGPYGVFSLYQAAAPGSNRIDYRTGGVNIVTVGGADQGMPTAGTPSVNVASKFAVGYKLNDYAAALNSGTVVPDATAAVPPMDAFSIGGLATGVFLLNGHIRQITYIPRRISNAELQTRTT